MAYHAEEGWYDDPEQPGLARYWDGGQWTDRRGDPSRIGTGPNRTLACASCGRTPTAQIEAHRSTGWLLFGVYRTISGPYCKACGLAVTREAICHSMIWGWSIIGLAYNPFLLAVSLRSLRALHGLADPAVPPSAPPLDPGRPIVQRAAGRLGLAISLVVFAAVAGLILVGLLG